jgi:hypothetical protein
VSGISTTSNVISFFIVLWPVSCGVVIHVCFNFLVLQLYQLQGGERRVIAPSDRSSCAQLAGAIDLALAESTNDLLASFTDLGVRCRSHDQAQKNDDALK